MKVGWRRAFGLTLLLALPFSTSLLLSGQEEKRDPLNPLEINQLRDAMLDPHRAIKPLREVFAGSNDKT